MAISLKEFEVAMEVLGATKLYDRELSIFDDILVPCFKVGGITLTYSGFSYVEPWGGIIPKNILSQAMAKFGENYLGGSNFGCGTVLTIQGLVVLSLMLENCYSKELADNLIDKIYFYLLNYPKIKSNFGASFTSVSSAKMQELCKVVSQYDNTVNPFGAYNCVLKPASSYLDFVDVSLIEEKDIVNLNLATTRLDTRFSMSINGFQYFTCAWNDEPKLMHRPHVCVNHQFYTGHDGKPTDEIISIDNSIGGYFEVHPDDVSLNISIFSGLAWETGGKCQAADATDEQIDITIAFLKSSIKRIENNILSNMLVTNS